jgi:hypothetical protein
MQDGAMVVTVCNRFPQEDYYCLNEWYKSLGGLKPLILGSNPGEYAGLASKPKLVYKAIKNKEIDTSHIIFCDCWDLVFSATLDEFFETFLAFNSPFVISAERNCFPADLKDEYDKLPHTSTFKYLNSGMIVAETEAMLAVLEAMDLPNVPDDHYDAEKNCMVHPNDQFMYQQVFLKQPVKMLLDYDQILCNTLHNVTVSDLDFSRDRIRLKETGTYPCSFHMNGSAKTEGLREPILKHLNLLP